MGRALATAALTADRIAALGITNQRESTVLWDRKSLAPVHNAIVWQCRRSAGICEKLKAEGLAGAFRERTGLLLDAYFSGTKIKWMLDEVPGLRARARSGEIAFGTIDAWLIARLTSGRLHVTDYTNASRTLMFNIHDRTWDPTCWTWTWRPCCRTCGLGTYGHTGAESSAPGPIAGSPATSKPLFGQLARGGPGENTCGPGVPAGQRRPAAA
jgi:glycerol kinase